MLKLAGSILILLCSFGLGLSGAESLRLHCRELRLLKQAVYLLRGEIRYAKETLPEAFGVLAARLDAPIAGLFSYAAEQLRQERGVSISCIWREAVQHCLSDSHLKKKEKEQLEELGRGMGYLDEEMQLSTLDLYLEQLEQSIKEAEGELQGKQKLYRSLGAAGGIFLVILLL